MNPLHRTTKFRNVRLIIQIIIRRMTWSLTATLKQVRKFSAYVIVPHALFTGAKIPPSIRISRLASPKLIELQRPSITKQVFSL